MNNLKTCIHARVVPLAHNVFEVIKNHLGLDFENVIQCSFDLDYRRSGFLTKIECVLTNNTAKNISLDEKQSRDLWYELATTFNLPNYSVKSARFVLKSDELPEFQISLYPYVSNPEKLSSNGLFSKVIG